jgi:hypothetical protein
MQDAPRRLNSVLNKLRGVEGGPLAHELVHFVFRYRVSPVFDMMVGAVEIKLWSLWIPRKRFGIVPGRHRWAIMVNPAILFLTFVTTPSTL